MSKESEDVEDDPEQEYWVASRKKADDLMRQALGQATWDKFWGPELERLGAAIAKNIRST